MSGGWRSFTSSASRHSRDLPLSTGLTLRHAYDRGEADERSANRE